MTLLKDIVQIEKGRKYNLLEENQEGAIRVFQANDFRNENKPLYTLDADGVLAQEDDIMLVWDGSVGQMGFGRSGYVGSTMVKLKVKNKEQFSPFFIYRFLQTKAEYLKRKATGATIMHINRKSLEQLEIPDLEIDDQLHIANILSKAENLIAQRKESIRLLDEFLKSTFLEMFGEPVTNPKGWGLKTLDKISNVGSSKRVFVEELVDSGIPFFRGTEIGHLGEGKNITPTLYITKEHFEELKSHTGVPVIGDLLMPSICPDGRIFRVVNNESFYFKDGRVLWVKPDQNIVNSFYLHNTLKRLFITNYNKIASGTTFAELKIVALKKIQVPMPPFELQTQFAQIVQKAEALKIQYQQSLQELENLYGSLSQKAFRGELVIKKSDAKVMALAPEKKPVQPELNKQQAFLRKLMLASHIICELCEEPTFGHTKLMKLLYLSEQAGRMALQTNYKKFAAGPFDGKTLTLIDKEYEKNKWFDLQKKTFSVNGQQREATVYKKTDKSLLYKKHFDNYFESEAESINRIINLFRKEKSQMAEIVATLYFTWKELLTANAMISENSLVNGFYQFHMEKKKFTEDQILLGYNYMLKNELYPLG
ncbi:MAG: restriction endonuclease subunit S [Bacteroidetes bacterium]|nr:restriction endonuclease subunit S [Bacteroidota bacterium]